MSKCFLFWLAYLCDLNYSVYIHAIIVIVIIIYICCLPIKHILKMNGTGCSTYDSFSCVTITRLEYKLSAPSPCQKNTAGKRIQRGTYTFQWTVAHQTDLYGWYETCCIVCFVIELFFCDVEWYACFWGRICQLGWFAVSFSALVQQFPRAFDRCLTDC